VPGGVQDVTILPPLPPPAPEPPPSAAPVPLATPFATALVAPAPLAPSAPAGAVEDLPRHGFSFGLRFDVGIPLGNTVSVPASADVCSIDSGDELSDVFGVLFPVTLDIGYRLTPHWYVGGYFSAGLGTPSSLCEANSTTTCDQNDIRWGFDVKYLGAPYAFLGPWVGAGAGWEIANNANSDNATSANGPEFFHLRAGLDFRLAKHLYVGPESMFTLAVFTNHLTGGVTAALHDWLTFGVGGHYDL